MASTDVDICNLALGIIGDTRIQTLADTSKEARECSRFYDQALDEALEAFDWPFARAYAAGVAPDDIDPVPGYLYSFNYPDGALAIRGIARSLKSEVSPEFTIATIEDGDGKPVRLLHTDREGGVIVYTRRETDVSVFTPLFVAAVAAKLAYYIAMPLTKDRAKRNDAAETFKETIEQAAVSVNNQGRAGLASDVMPDWIRARG